jgi:pyruvate dehydrogenase E2 component (dihydrolipoamide acetyltransferase)
MATEFKLPELGENIAAGDIVSVLVKEGDVIAPNTAVVEIETDKAVIEVPSPQGGRVTKVHIKKGDTVSVGGTLITLEPAAAGAAAPAAKPQQAAPAAAAPAAKQIQPQAVPVAQQAAPAAPKPQPAVAQATAVPTASTAVPTAKPTATTHQTTHQAADHGNSNGGGNGVGTADPAGPAVRRLARELGVDLGRVHGTGPGGRITRDDVVNAVRQLAAGTAPAAPARPQAPAATTMAPSAPAAAAPSAPSLAADGTADRDAWGPIRRQAMAKIRKTIAINMANSSATIPHVTNFDDADVTELEAIRKASVADYEGTNIKITMMSFLLKAIAHSLKLHPTLNASIDMERGEIIYKDYVNIGVAVDTPRGLVVPVMRNVDKMAIPQIAQALTALAERAKASQYTVDELRGGTFTISNMGTVGGTYSTPIINSPEVAVLLIGRSRKLPVVMKKDDRIEPRLMMPLSLSYDHRLVDGANAARFLNEVINYLEVPGRLLLAP